VTDDDIFDWANYRKDHDKISAATVNGNDLAAAASLFAYAKSRLGK
jgi:hypothetical protein